MTAIAPLTYTTIKAWAELMRIILQPHETEALIMLDTAFVYKDEEEDEEEKPLTETPAWPKRKES